MSESAPKIGLAPAQQMIITEHTDRPGIIGKVGTLLGDNGINIAGMHVGRESEGHRALMVLMVDSPIDDAVLEKITKIEGMETARLVSL